MKGTVFAVMLAKRTAAITTAVRGAIKGIAFVVTLAKTTAAITMKVGRRTVMIADPRSRRRRRRYWYQRLLKAYPPVYRLAKWRES